MRDIFIFLLYQPPHWWVTGSIVGAMSHTKLWEISLPTTDPTNWPNINPQDDTTIQMYFLFSYVISLEIVSLCCVLDSPNLFTLKTNCIQYSSGSWLLYSFSRSMSIRSGLEPSQPATCLNALNDPQPISPHRSPIWLDHPGQCIPSDLWQLPCQSAHSSFQSSWMLLSYKLPGHRWPRMLFAEAMSSASDTMPHVTMRYCSRPIIASASVGTVTSPGQLCIRQLWPSREVRSIISVHPSS